MDFQVFPGSVKYSRSRQILLTRLDFAPGLFRAGVLRAGVPKRRRVGDQVRSGVRTKPALVSPLPLPVNLGGLLKLPGRCSG